MTDRAHVSPMAEGPQVRPESASQRYEIAIGGAYKQTISAAIAELTFQRWQERLDVLMRGDLRTGFCWQWPDVPRTRVTVTPVADKSAAAAQTGGSGDISAPLPVPEELR